MEGNNKMVIRFLFLCFLFIVIFQSCSPVRITEKEMIGTWVASDNATLILNKDGTFTLEGFDPRFWNWNMEWYHEKPSIKVNGNGRWKARNDNSRSFLQMYFVEVRNKPAHVMYNGNLKKYERMELPFQMDIMGSNFPFYNKPPWILYVCSDIDGGNLYEFYKKGSGLAIDKKEK